MFGGRQISLDSFIAKAQGFWEQKDSLNTQKTSWALRIVTFLTHLFGFAYVALLCADLQRVTFSSSQTTFSTLLLPALAFVVVLIGLSNTWINTHMQSLAVLHLPARIEVLFWRSYYECNRARAHIQAFIEAAGDYPRMVLPKWSDLPLMVELQSWLHELTCDCQAISIRTLPLLLDTRECLTDSPAPLFCFTRTPRAVNLLC